MSPGHNSTECNRPMTSKARLRRSHTPANGRRAASARAAIVAKPMPNNSENKV